MTRKRTVLVGALVVFASAVACDGAAELKPAKTANQVSGLKGAVTSTRQGVEMVAQVNHWPGDVRIQTEVTPVRTIIHNRSDQPIRIRYNDFTLRARNGTAYAAIPPRQVEGVVETEMSVEPAFGYRAFYPAGYYGNAFGLEPYAGPFRYDGAYHSTNYSYWDTTTELPTPEMLSRALPEGVLERGGNLDGYLYFAAIHQDEGSLITLRADLRSVDGDRTVASIELPFVVD